MSANFLSPFVDASALLRPNPAEVTYGCVMADFDNDGLPEILVVTVQGPNRLYKWSDSRLVDVAPPILRDLSASGIGVAAADFSGNGFLDIYLLNTSAFFGPDSDPDRLLINNGELKFDDLMARNPVTNFAAGRSVCWFDPDGLGKPYAFICNYLAPCCLYGLDANGMLQDYAPELGLDVITGGRSAVAGDILGSGRMDLFTGNEGDANRLFRNDGNGRFTDVAADLGLDDPFQNMRGLALCDFNRDGRMDLVWGNWEGPHRMMQQQPDGSFVDVANEDFARPSRVRTVIVLDYDNDGWDDIFLNNLGEANRLFHNNGDGTFSEVDPGDLAQFGGLGTGATAGDINGDGFIDIFISHGEGSPMPNALLLNSPNGNNWLRVHPLTAAGAAAIGAKVIIFPEGDTRPITRIIDGGSGYLCQTEPVAHAGLAKAARAASVEIRFTTGQVCNLQDVEANQNVFVKPAGESFVINLVRQEA
ncbi:CRTAC1 family protein [soil metagenome]